MQVKDFLGGYFYAAAIIVVVVFPVAEWVLIKVFKIKPPKWFK